MKKIILCKRADYWGVWLYGIERMPEDVELPLPFAPTTSVLTVAADMRRRFPGATLFYRNTLGHLSHVA